MPARKKTTLDKAQLFYIRAKMADVKPASIAADLEVPVEVVKKQIEEFRVEDRTEAPGQPEAPKPEPSDFEEDRPVAKFAVNKGSYAMTPAQSMQDDDLPKGENKDFFNHPKLKGCVHFERPKEKK